MRRLLLPLPSLFLAFVLPALPAAAGSAGAAREGAGLERVPARSTRQEAVRPAEGGALVHLVAGSFDPLRERLGFEAAALDSPEDEDASYGLVQLRPGHAQAREELEERGVRFFGYVPDLTWQVRLTPEALGLLAAHPAVRWVGTWRAGFRVHPRLWPGETGEPFLEVRVNLFPDASAEKVSRLLLSEFPLAGESGRLERGASPHVRFVLPASVRDAFVARAARVRGTAWIEPYDPPSLRNVDASGPIQGNASGAAGRSLFGRGLTGTGQVVAVADSGCDTDLCFFRGLNGVTAVTDATNTVPPALGPLFPAQKVLGYFVQPGATAYDNDNVCTSSSTSFHGTHTSGTAVGDNFATPSSASSPGVDAGDGMAPNAQLLFQDVGNDETGCLSGLGDLEAMFAQAADAGARIHSNSWGGSTYGAYTGDDQLVDHFAFGDERIALFFSAGNEGRPTGGRTSTIGSPANSKNGIAVGALLHGESVGVANYSSRGPTVDRRVKPDLMAPGTSTVSAGGNGLHTDLGCATRSLSGTSMACPTAAGGAALLRQYFADGFYPTGRKNSADARELTGPEVKAVLLNGTLPLPQGGSFGGGDFGWGRVFLDSNLFFEGDSRELQLFSLANAEGLTTGDQRPYTVTVPAGQELRVTLVWSDPEGTLGSAKTLVNDLDLVVSDGVRSYRGNVLGTSGESAEGGDPDSVNNVEQVRLLSPAAGTYTVTVAATNVPGNGRTYTDRQGFALAVSRAACTGAVSAAPSGVTASSNAAMGVDLSFSPAAGSTLTQVYRAKGDCSAAMGAFRPVGTATGGTFTDGRAQGGERYAYRLRGADGCGEGPASPCATIVPTGRCDLLPSFAGLQTVRADGTTCRIVLGWTAGSAGCASPSGAPLYNVYRGTSPGFTPSAENLLATVGGTSYADQTPLLSSGVTYYYVVRMEDGTSGGYGPNGGNEDGNLVERFATAAGAPGATGTFADGAGDGSAWMAAEAPWTISDQQARDGRFSYHNAPEGSFYPADTCASLTTPTLVLGTGSVLSYWVRYNLEHQWDGVVVEISTDGGATWQTLRPTNPPAYPGTLADTGNPPVNACSYPRTQEAFTGPVNNGALTDWERYEHQLSPEYDGRTVNLRWRFASDPGAEYEGFYLDSLSVTNVRLPGACAPASFTPVPGGDGLPGVGKK